MKPLDNKANRIAQGYSEAGWVSSGGPSCYATDASTLIADYRTYWPGSAIVCLLPAFHVQQRLQAVAGLSSALEDRPFQAPSAVNTSRHLRAFESYKNPNDVQH